MFVEYSLNQDSFEVEKNSLSLIAQQRYPDDEYPLLKLLQELDILSRLCPKLDVQAYFDNDEKVVFINNHLSNAAPQMLMRMEEAALMMNKVLKNMSMAISHSLSYFGNGFVSPETGSSIKHFSDMMLLDYYLRNSDLESSGIIPYAFYANSVRPYYPAFIASTRSAVHLQQQHARGNIAYNPFKEETFRPLYNEGKIGTLPHLVDKNEDLLARDISARVIDLLGAYTEDQSELERRNHDKAYQRLQNSPYSACLLLNDMIEVVKFTSRYPVDEIVEDLMILTTENRTILSVLNAYSKQLSWYAKDLDDATYILLHLLIKNQSEWYGQNPTTPLPEDIYSVLESMSLSDDKYILRKNIIITCCYRDDESVIQAVFKQFNSALEFYSKVEAAAKARYNVAPIADLVKKEYRPLFHNPRLDRSITLEKYREELPHQKLN